MSVNPKNIDWVSASRQDPCWHCGEPRWCRRARNGSVTICRRNMSGGQVLRDRNDVEYCKVIHDRELAEATTPRPPAKVTRIVPLEIPPVQRDALTYVAAYRGRNLFLRDMHRAANDPAWVPTVEQAQAILTVRSELPVSQGGGGTTASLRSRDRRTKKSSRQKKKPAV